MDGSQMSILYKNSKSLTSKVYCSDQPPHGKEASNVFKLNKHFSVNWYVNYIGFPHLITTNTSSSIKITVGSRKLERLVRRKIKSVIPEECCLLGLNFVHRCTQGHILFQIKLHANLKNKNIAHGIVKLIYKVGDTLLQSKRYFWLIPDPAQECQLNLEVQKGQTVYTLER